MKILNKIKQFKYLKYVKYVVIFTGILGIYIFNNYFTPKKVDSEIQIQGAVNKPGVYKIKENESLANALQQAQLKNGADLSKINLSDKNSKKIYIPYQSNNQNQTSYSNNLPNKKNTGATYVTNNYYLGSKQTPKYSTKTNSGYEYKSNYPTKTNSGYEYKSNYPTKTNSGYEYKSNYPIKTNSGYEYKSNYPIKTNLGYKTKYNKKEGDNKNSFYKNELKINQQDKFNSKYKYEPNNNKNLKYDYNNPKIQVNKANNFEQLKKLEELKNKLLDLYINKSLNSINSNIKFLNEQNNSKNNSKQPNNKGVNKSNTKQIHNKGINKNNSKQPNNKRINKSNSKHPNNKGVNKSNTKQINNKGINKSNSKQLNNKIGQNHFKQTYKNNKNYNKISKYSNQRKTNLQTKQPIIINNYYQNNKPNYNDNKKNIQKPIKVMPKAPVILSPQAYLCSKYNDKVAENNKHKNSPDYVNLNDFLLEPKNPKAQATFNKFRQLFRKYTDTERTINYDLIGRYVYHQKNHHLNSFCDLYYNKVLKEDADYDIISNFAQIY